ncbi:MAG TPA: squalene/phytoene synthase family protein [Caldilineae bacterium]|nr:squalene/phytoene synthase family protein [Caldilineae bacterium]
MKTMKTLQVETKADWEYCEEVLPKVSRTFALNIGELEGETRRAVLLGYLLFRIADTFEDNDHQSEEEKIKALLEFAEIFKGHKGLEERLSLYEPLKFRWAEDSPEKNLVENGDRVLRCYFDLPQIYRETMDPHVVETAEGMARFQKRKLEQGGKFFQPRDLTDLEDYCYYVAGNVGVMLTQIFCLREGLPKRELEKRQVQFGLALQLTNIVKDYTKDLERGWCYIPASVTEKYGLKPEDLRHLSIEESKKILQELVPRVVYHFDSTLNYIKILPEREKDIRLFCLIPFVLAYYTLLQIVEGKGEKLSRPQVATILDKCKLFVGSNGRLEEDYLEVRKALISFAQQEKR